MNQFLLTLIVCFLGLFQALSQDVVFDGKISELESGKSLSGVSIKAIADGATVSSTTTSSNGQYTLNVPVGKLYKIEYSKSGYVTKIMKIHTEDVTDEDLPIGGKVMPAVDIDLFTTKEAVDFSFLDEEPVVEWNWDSKKLRMDWDKKVYNKTKDKIDDLLKEADQKEQENEAKFNELVSEADKLFDAEDYKASLEKYEEAIKIPGKEMAEHPNMRILELDELMQAEAKEELQKEQSGEKYKETIAEAESLRENEKYDEAIDKFYEALDLKPDEVYPLDQIDELNVLLKEKENKIEYERLVKMGDDFLEQNSLKAAKDKFERAQQLMPEESYPKEQLKKIEDQFEAAEEERLRKEKYDEAVSAADAFFDEEDYENAKEKYEEAIGYESAATYPKARLDLVNEKLDEMADELAKEAAYDSLIVIADEALENSQYDEAVAQYDEALTLKENDSYATSQKEKAEAALAELEDAEAMEAKINELLTEAENHFQEEDFASAIEEFDAVLALDENNEQASQGKEKSQKAIEKKEEEAELQASFDEKIKQADELFEADKLDSAKIVYEAANEIISDDEHVVNQLDLIEKTQNEAAAEKQIEEQIEGLLKEADQELDEENWQNAVDKFDAVLELDESNEDATSGKESALEKLEEIAEKEDIDEQFQSIVEEAVELFENEKYKSAIEKYEEAIAVKEDDEVTAKIEEIEGIIAEIEANKSDEENYQAAIETGDEAMANDSFDNAISAYNEALSIKENDETAKEKLEEATKKKEENDIFEKLVQEGAELADKESWSEAKEKYEEAKAINETETVTTQLEIINKKLNELSSEEELEEQYQNLIEEAKSLESDEAYQEAIEKFEEALKVKEDDSYAIEKIEKLEAEIKKLEESNEENIAYQEKMDAGKESMNNGDYAEAIEAFDDALEIITDDSEALAQKEIAKEALEELAKEEEEYQKLLANAKTKKEDGELEEAKVMYKEAQDQRPKDAIPQNAIVEIDELLRIREESEGTEKRYNDKIDEAEKKAEDLKYEEAIDLFKEAGAIKPAEELPKKRVQEIQDLIDEMKSASEENTAYDDKIKEADIAFDNNDFEESIDLYKEALKLDEEKTYPNDQIDRAEAKLKSIEEDRIDQEFQQYMKKGNGALANEDYAEAIDFYNDALEVKPDNLEAKDRKAEAEALLDEDFAKKAEDEENRKKYDDLITEADDLFDAESFVDAKDKYQEALNVIQGDQYAIDRIEESVAMAQEKVKKGDDARYQKIIDKADEYFDEENYDKATSLYQRALGLRSQDQYPADQLEEIERIKAGEVKKDQELEYLGEEEDISIMEGAALLEEAENKRQNLKAKSVIDQTKKYEDVISSKNKDDLDERLDVQNEVTKIHDLRVGGVSKNNKNQQDLAVELDATSFSIAEQRMQENKYERASILKQNEALTYNEDDYRNIHKEKSSEHLAIADKIDEIRVEYDLAQNEKNLEAIEKWQSNDGKFSEYDDDRKEDYKRAIELRKVNEEYIKEQTDYQDKQHQANTADNYNKILAIQSDATDIEREIAAKHKDKTNVQAEIEKDILALEKVVKDKNQKETRELIDAQLKSDELITAAHDKYLETMEGADEGRKETIASIKKTNEGIDLQKQARNQRKEADIRGTEEVVLEAKIKNEEHLREMNEDLVEEFIKIDGIDNKLKRQAELEIDEETRSRQKTMNEVDNTNILQNKIHSEKKAKTEENNERIKNMNASTDKKLQEKSRKEADRRIENQQKIDKEAQKEKEPKPIIANTLGDDFPEGVSQETFVTKDKDGLPVKVITRRIVVVQGRGIEYRRIQTRNGIAYSKNGAAITENTWNKDTMNAKLEKHF